MRSMLRILVLLTAVGAFCAVGGARAATVRQLSLKDMSSIAQIVVEGRVESVQAQWRHRRIFREVQLVADKVIKGPLKPGQPVTLWVPGGEVGDLGQWVAGSPEFSVGERVLLFLEANETLGYVVVGMSLGKLRTERDKAGDVWAIRDPVEGLTAPPLRVSWDLLERTVRTAK